MAAEEIVAGFDPPQVHVQRIGETESHLISYDNYLEEGETLSGTPDKTDIESNTGGTVESITVTVVEKIADGKAIALGRAIQFTLVDPTNVGEHVCEVSGIISSSGRTPIRNIKINIVDSATS